MFHFDLQDPAIKKIHLIGIGGVSMSGIAELLHIKGYEITGSNLGYNKYVRHLLKLGIPITDHQTKDNVRDQDLFIYTDAIQKDNEELIAAKASGTPCVTRGQFLGALMRNYPSSIAVSGSHGKSTTTSMIADILIRTEEDPTILLGGSLDEIGGNVLAGKGDFFLAEACEYMGNVRYAHPRLAVVLNIDLDHLDYFKDLDDIIHLFETYMENMTPQSIAVINLDDPNSASLPSHVRGQAYTFSYQKPEADYFIHKIRFNAIGQPSFQLRFPDGSVETYQLGVLGRFNIQNATAAIIACDRIGVDRATIKAGIEGYRALHRRMEYLGDFHGAKVLTDYGHHPVEIQATLQALSEHKQGKLYCVFQPYTLSRTKTLMPQFAKSFFDCDLAIITKIQVAREKDTGEVTGQELVEKILAEGQPAIYKETFEDCLTYLAPLVQENDLILTTGCGNVDELGDMMVNAKPLTMLP